MHSIILYAQPLSPSTAISIKTWGIIEGKVSVEQFCVAISLYSASLSTAAHPFKNQISSTVRQESPRPRRNQVQMQSSPAEPY